MRVAQPVTLTVEQRATLERQARARSLPARTVERAGIVLRAADGRQDLQIAEELGITAQKAARWRKRFLDGGLAALERDAPRSGGPRTITDLKVQQVIRKTTQGRPSGATQWSTRTMAAATGLSEASVRRIWHAHGLKPHLVRTFKLSNDPQFAEKLEAIVGLYRPGHASCKNDSSYRGQLCHPQTSQGATMAGSPSSLPNPLHSYRQFLAQPGGTLFPRSDAQPPSARRLSRCRRTHRSHRRLRRSP